MRIGNVYEQQDAKSCQLKGLNTHIDVINLTLKSPKIPGFSSQGLPSLWGQECGPVSRSKILNLAQDRHRYRRVRPFSKFLVYRNFTSFN